MITMGLPCFSCFTSFFFLQSYFKPWYIIPIDRLYKETVGGEEDPFFFPQRCACHDLYLPKHNAPPKDPQEKDTLSQIIALNFV